MDFRKNIILFIIIFYKEHRTMKNLKTLTNKIERTKALFAWMQKQDDTIKMSYRLNWRIPHSLFNISCKYFKKSDLQNIDWFGLFRGDYETLKWSHELNIMVN